jgi:hypothetical protein
MRVNKVVAGFFIVLALSGCVVQNDLASITSDSPKKEIQLGKLPANEYFPNMSEKFNTPWPTNVSRSELVNSALHNAFTFFDSNRSSDCKVAPRVHSGESVLEEHRPLLEKLSNEMVFTFCNYLKNDFDVIGGSYDFVEETISTKKIKTDFYRGCQRPENDWAMACVYDGVAWIGISLGSSHQGKSFVEERRLTIAAHEIFHLIHDQIDPDAGGEIPPRDHYRLPFRPMWLIEGGGEFFGRLMPYYFGMIGHYSTWTPTDRSGLFISKEYLSNLELMEERQSAADGFENYYSGNLAMEYLVASIGMKSVLDIWVNMGEGQSFEAAFKNASGIELAEFYEKFRQMHNNLYEGELVTN